jgi:hypothetical protein
VRLVEIIDPGKAHRFQARLRKSEEMKGRHASLEAERRKQRDRAVLLAAQRRRKWGLAPLHADTGAPLPVGSPHLFDRIVGFVRAVREKLHLVRRQSETLEDGDESEDADDDEFGDSSIDSSLESMGSLDGSVQEVGSIGSLLSRMRGESAPVVNRVSESAREV